MMPFDYIEYEIIQKIKEIFEDHNFIESGWTEWTKQILEKLCVLGQGKGYKVCTNQSAVPNSNFPEWLYDMTWVDYQDDYLLDVALVLECEWSKKEEDIYPDFEKLLLANAHNKVMIFQSGNYNIFKKIVEQFKKMILVFKAIRVNEKYLFAGFNWDNKKFEFETFIPFRNINLLSP